VARFFISSRMRELFWERKKVVELLHFQGHTPLFFETEPRQEDPKGAKPIMDGMIDNSQALVQIHYLTCGGSRTDYEHRTPIEYEFERFLETRRGPCILLKKTLDKFDIVDPRLKELTKKVATADATQVIEFRNDEELTQKFLKCIHEISLEKDKLQEQPGFVIRYSGDDYIGLIAAVAKVIFHDFRLNITYMSYAAAGGFATLCLACSPREVIDIDLDEYRGKLQEALKSDLKNEATLALKENRFIVRRTQEVNHEKVSVELEEKPERIAECYLEVRHIDLPGQVKAICDVLKDLWINIDELQLHPVEYGYEKQRILRLWISKPSSEESFTGSREDTDTICRNMTLELEDQLTRLIGVRSVSVRRIFRGL